jgi:hypothetical protein
MSPKGKVSLYRETPGDGLVLSMTFAGAPHYFRISHMSKLAKLLHAPAFILRATGAFRDLCASKCYENFLYRACSRIHGVCAGDTAKAAKAHPVFLINIHVRKGDLFSL